MATNPLYNTNDSPNNATQPSKAVNDPQVFVNRNRNTFDLSYFNFKTQRFGVYDPFFVMEGVPGDTIPLHSSHQVRSLPMSSPFLSSLTLSKDSFLVPMQSILPNTWEMIYANPASGDDVPADVMPLFDPFTSIYRVVSSVVASPQFDNIHRIKLAFVLESVFSSGSLLGSLGLPFQDTLKKASSSFDYAFDQFVSKSFVNSAITFTFPDGTQSNISTANLPLSVFIDYIRQNICYITGYSGTSVDLTFFQHFDEDYQLITEDLYYEWNLSRVLAYQIICQQFYVNTKIDPIYNSQIYRDNFFYILKNCASRLGVPNSISLDAFNRNGILIPYDYFSKHYFDKFENINIESQDFAKVIDNYTDVYEYLFWYRRVLKFGDYFTDSRTQPLGSDVNGQMNAPVVGDKVAAIDMSKSIVMQRFLNNVVKLGNDFGEYLRGIFGTEPSPDFHFPKFISHQEFNISGFEVANSNDVEQGKLVTNLNSNDDTYQFEVRVDMPCIIMSISSFNCPRLYGNSKSRFFFHKDRFDMFNPMLQYIGDQPILRAELNSDSDGKQVFGYNSRNSEYKQSYSVASGGFLYYLPSWTFIADFGPDYDAVPTAHQGPEFIRVYPFEFDRFYKTLSGYSLASAFHFIVVYNNKVMCSRPMAVNPSIL